MDFAIPEAAELRFPQKPPAEDVRSENLCLLFSSLTTVDALVEMELVTEPKVDHADPKPETKESVTAWISTTPDPAPLPYPPLEGLYDESLPMPAIAPLELLPLLLLLLDDDDIIFPPPNLEAILALASSLKRV